MSAGSTCIDHIHTMPLKTATTTQCGWTHIDCIAKTHTCGPHNYFSVYL